MKPKHNPVKLREWRKMRGLTLMELGQRTNQNYQNVQRHEVGENEMTVQQLLAYAAALDVSACELLADFREEGETDPPKLRDMIRQLRRAPPHLLDGMHLFMAKALAPPTDEARKRGRFRR